MLDWFATGMPTVSLSIRVYKTGGYIPNPDPTYTSW
jgi:hypothetical protein